MGISNIEYHNLYTKHLLNGDNILDRLNRISFTIEDRYVRLGMNINEDPVRFEVLHIEIDMILRFIYDNEHNFAYATMRRLANLLNRLLRANVIDQTNVSFVGRVKSIAIGYGLV